MTAARPNVLFIMTDEERYPPPYEEPADDEWELHNLTADPEERANRAVNGDAGPVLAQLRTVLEQTRESMRRTPRHVNPTP